MNRIDYIDGMRGLAMLFIVMGHVSDLVLGYQGPLFFGTIAIPIFFFISGLVFYKTERVSITVTCSSLVKKIPTLLAFPILVFLLWCRYSGVDIIEGVFREYKAGYWFTLLLFQFIFVFTIMTFILRKCLSRDICVLGIILFISLLLWIDVIRCPVMSLMGSFGELISFNLSRYFVFFVLGALLRYCIVTKNYAIHILRINYMPLVLISIFISTSIFYQEIRNVFGGTVTDFSHIISAVLLIWIYMKKIYQSKVDILTNSLKKIGQHTLGIYLLHYFFIPRGLKEHFESFFSVDDIQLISIIVSLCISLCIIFMSLVLEDILCLSSDMSKYMFGRKKTKTCIQSDSGK